MKRLLLTLLALAGISQFVHAQCTALDFDGIDDNVDCGNTASINITSSLTIEAWINPTVSLGSGINDRIVDKDSTSSYYFGGLLGTSDALAAGLGGTVVSTAAGVITPGVWQHVAFTFDDPTDQVFIYLNGLQVGTGSFTGSLSATGNVLRIGSHTNGAQDFYSGMIEDVRIWDIARSQTEIQADMNSCLSGGESGLKALYDFEDGTGSPTLTELTGNGNTGTLVNMDAATDWTAGQCCTPVACNIVNQEFSAAQGGFICTGSTTVDLTASESGISYFLISNANDSVIDGPVLGTGGAISLNTGSILATTTYDLVARDSGSSLLFDGLDDYVSLGAPIDVSTGNTMSLEAWFATTDVSTNSDYALIRQDQAGTSDWQLSFQNNGTILSFGVFASSYLELDVPIVPASVEDGMLHHVAASYDGADLRLYLDGVEIGSTGHSGNVQYTAAASVAIGANPNGPSDFFNGNIDEVRIWSTARAPQEMWSGMMSCVDGTEPGLVGGYGFEEGTGLVLGDTSTSNNDGTLINGPTWDTGWGCCTREMANSAIVTISPIGDQGVSAPQLAFCDNGSTSIEVDTTEVGLDYYLRDDANDTVVAGPTAGTGGLISFATGTLISTMTYNVYAVNPIDSLNCSLEMSTMVTITINPSPVGSVVVTNVSCNGGNDAAIDLTVSSGTPAFTFDWDNDGVGDNDDPEDLSGLVAGAYQVVIIDANGCDDTVSVMITQPATPLGASAVLDNAVSCAGGNDGQATASGAGGTSPYTYQWDAAASNQTTATATGLSGGTYSVTVMDANGCTDVTLILVSQPGFLTSVSIVNNGTTCNGGSDGSATVTPNGGTSPYTYLWDNAETTGTATGLNAGVHSVTVDDANGCGPVVSSVTITEPPAIVITTDSIYSTTCNGGNDGQAFISITNAIPPNLFDWDFDGTGDNDDLEDQSGLQSGTNNVTITDVNGCTQTAMITITEPTAVTASFSVTQPIGCNGGNDGIVTASGVGGTPGYTYLWSNGDATAMADSLVAGTYIVSITDVNGCGPGIDSILVTEPTAIGIAITNAIDPSTCGFSDGSIDITVGGGTPGYLFDWDNDGTGDNDDPEDLTGLPAGIYNVIVIDANGCQDSAAVTLSDPGGPVVTLDSIVDNPCTGDSMAGIYITVNFGLPPYSFDWNDDGIGDNDDTEDLDSLPAGNYLVIVTDQNGCQSFSLAQVVDPLVLTMTLSSSNISCNGAVDGTATANGEGGTSPYTYSWSNGDNSAMADSLSPGTYVVTVTDIGGCTTIDSLSFTEPPALVVMDTSNSITCNGAGDGNAGLAVSGGTPGYTYLWSTSSTAPSISGLAAGTYGHTVTDAGGCMVIDSVAIIEPAVMVVTTLATDPDCNAPNAGSIVSGPVGGTTPYSYLWSNAATTPTITGLSGGTFTVTVTDANGCTAITTDSVNSGTALNLTATQSSGGNPICQNECDLITISGGANVSTYTWNLPTGTLVSSDTAKCINPGIGTWPISVIASDTAGCFDTVNVTIIVDPCIGVEEWGEGFTVEMFPNPTRESTTLGFSYIPNNGTVRLFDALGKELVRKRIVSNTHVMNMEQYEAGMYYVRVNTESQLRVLKLVVE